MAFDLLQLGGHAVMAAPCVDRRKRLEDVFTAGAVSPQLALVPAFEDARRLWTAWVVEWGGEGIVLKDRRSSYKPGAQSANLVEGEEQARAPHRGPLLRRRACPVGRRGQACVMAFAYREPRTGEFLELAAEGSVRVRHGTCMKCRESRLVLTRRLA